MSFGLRSFTGKIKWINIRIKCFLISKGGRDKNILISNFHHWYKEIIKLKYQKIKIHLWWFITFLDSYLFHFCWGFITVLDHLQPFRIIYSSLLSHYYRRWRPDRSEEHLGISPFIPCRWQHYRQASRVFWSSRQGWPC